MIREALGLNPDNFALVPVILNCYRLGITMLHNKMLKCDTFVELSQKHAIADMWKSNQSMLFCIVRIIG